MENEIWKDILGYKGFYQASNIGRIKSLNYMKTGKEKILLQYNSGRGYLQVELKGKKYLVHRLVWETFNGKIPEGMEINHIDENPTNNVLSNLSLMSHKENINWGTRTNRVREITTNGKCSKKVLQYDIDGRLIKEYPSIIEVERQLGFLNSNIVQCCKGNYKQAYGYIWKYKGTD